MSNSQEQEALARQLWSIHRETLGYMANDYPDWEHEQVENREAWIQVAQYVEKMCQGVMSNTLMTYGYNGKEPYHGLDELITPDHK